MKLIQKKPFLVAFLFFQPMIVGQFWHLQMNDPLEQYAALVNILMFECMFTFVGIGVSVFLSVAPLLGLEIHDQIPEKESNE